MASATPPSSSAGKAWASTSAALTAMLVYAVCASLWIALSDELVGRFFSNPRDMVIASTLKGWLFVGVTSLLLFVLLRRFQLASIPEEPSPARTGSSRALRWGVALAVLAVILVGAATIRSLTERHEAKGIAQLQAVAKLKTRQIESWLNERRGDAEQLRTASADMSVLDRWQHSGDSASRDTILARLESLRRIYHYETVFVVDAGGNVLLGTDSHRQSAPILRELTVRALASGQVQFSDFYRESIAGVEHLRLDFVVPVATAGAKPTLAVVLRVSQDQFLFPFLQEWPVPSASAETLLVRAEGDGVLFLNELRHRTGTALKLRFPLSEDKLLAVQVISGRVEPDRLLVGTDYRGVPVAGVARRVAGTPWYLIAKMDRAELYQEMKQDLFWIALTLTFALLATLSIALLLRQRRELRWAATHQQEQAENWWLQQKVEHQHEERIALTSHYATLIEKARDIVLLLDESGCIVDANQAAVAAYGWSLEELIGMNMGDLCVDDPPALVEQRWQASAGPEGVLFETVHRRNDGSRFPVEVSVSIIAVGEKRYRQNFIRDIAERKLAEAMLAKLQAQRVADQASVLEEQRQGRLAALNLMEDAIAERTNTEVALVELEENRERLKLALQAANQGIWDLDVQTGESVVSPEYATMLGYDPVSFHETHTAWIERLHPDDRDRVAQAYRDCIAGNTDEYSVEFRQKTHSGDWKWILSVGRLVARDASGNPLRMLGTHTDITERKNSELALATYGHRAEAMLTLFASAETMNEQEFMQYGMELAEQLTGSRIAFLHFVKEDQKTIELAAWSRATLEHYCQAAYNSHYPIDQAGIWADALRQGVPVLYNDYAAAPGKRGLPEGHSHLERLISVPVISDGLVRMMAGVGNKPLPYTELDVETVKLLANDIWHILSQRRLHAALGASEILNRSTLDSVSAEIAVLDRGGVITAVNQAWRRFALENGIEPGQPVPGTEVGADYLAVCRDRTGGAIAEARDADEGIRAVLDGRLPDFRLEYPCHSPDQQRWFSMQVTPLGKHEGGVVIAHTNITARKLAEEVSRQQIKELRQWHEVMLGRESRVLELKIEVNELRRRLGETARYPSVEEAPGVEAGLVPTPSEMPPTK